ncbi:hypothetical protein A3N57_13280 [Enterobacter cloacae subsp. dissolvens]|nr:hypothetical protein A3N57_13280 [Enterobacter cloacae subsp. dissolvens]
MEKYLLLTEKHHSGVMKFVITDKDPISGKTGVVLVVDSVLTNFIVPLVGTTPGAACFIVTSIR